MFAKFTNLSGTDRVGLAACASVLAMVVFNILVLASETGVPASVLTSASPLVTLA